MHLTLKVAKGTKDCFSLLHRCCPDAKWKFEKFQHKGAINFTVFWCRKKVRLKTTMAHKAFFARFMRPVFDQSRN